VRTAFCADLDFVDRGAFASEQMSLLVVFACVLVCEFVLVCGFLDL
jgi:hypothetical protein